MSAQTTDLPVSTYSSTVAAVIRAECGRRNLKQRGLATLLGMSQQSASDRWCGKTPWTFDDVQRVEAVLQMDPGAILTEVVRHQGLEPRTR